MGIHDIGILVFVLPGADGIAHIQIVLVDGDNELILMTRLKVQCLGIVLVDDVTLGQSDAEETTGVDALWWDDATLRGAAVIGDGYGCRCAVNSPQCAALTGKVDVAVYVIECHGSPLDFRASRSGYHLNGYLAQQVLEQQCLYRRGRFADGVGSHHQVAQLIVGEILWSFCTLNVVVLLFTTCG